MRLFRSGEYHGTAINERRIGDLNFATTVRGANTTVERHAHDHPTFIALMRGKHSWVTENNRIKWSVPFVWYYRPAHVPHSHESCTTDIVSLGISFDPSSAPELECMDDRFVLDSTVGKAIAEQVLAELSCPDAATDHALVACFHRLVAEYLRSARSIEDQSVPHWIAQVRQWLDDNALSAPSLDQCAKAANAHPSHLARSFKRAFGQTIKDYVRDRQLEWSHRQILTTDAKIANVAARAGFSDHAHFTRAFKESFGYPPSEVRKPSFTSSGRNQ